VIKNEISNTFPSFFAISVGFLLRIALRSTLLWERFTAALSPTLQQIEDLLRGGDQGGCVLSGNHIPALCLDGVDKG